MIHVTTIDLRSVLSPEIAEALTRLMDERIEVALGGRARDDGSPWLTLAEAAERLRVSERTVARMVKREQLGTTTVGRRRLVHRDELDTVVNAAAGEGTAPTVPPRHRGWSVDGRRAKA